MSKQLLLNDLIKAVEQRQQLKSVLVDVGDILITIDDGSSTMLSDLIKWYDNIIEFIREQVDRDRTKDMSNFWTNQVQKEKEKEYEGY